MKIAVCIKQVPINNSAKMDEKTGNLVRGKSLQINPYDYYAIETALLLKDKYKAKVDVYSMAPKFARNVFYDCFALGCDSGYLVTDSKFAGADIIATSYTLSNAIKKTDNYDLIICGRQTIDGDTSAIGAAIASQLNIPSVLYVSKVLNINNEFIEVVAKLTNEIVTYKIKLPCVICIEKDSVVPRFPTLRNKLMAKNKVINEIGIENLDDNNDLNYGQSGSKTKVKKIYNQIISAKSEQVSGSIQELANFIDSKINEVNNENK